MKRKHELRGPLSRETVVLLRRYLSPEAIASLQRMPGQFREGFILIPPTRGQARAEARRIAALARDLAAALDISRFRLRLHPSYDAFTDARPVNHIELQRTLEALAKRMQVVLAATGDDPSVPRWSLPGRGKRTDIDPRVSLVGDAILAHLYAAGVRVTHGETGPAVRCVAAVFADFGIDADSRRCVRGAIRRLPFLRGGRSSRAEG